MSQNIHFYPTCKLKNKLQLKSQKIIIHIIMSDFKQSDAQSDASLL
jgi:hypothetical protein